MREDSGKTYDEDETQVLHTCPFQRIHFFLVGWVPRRRLIIRHACACENFLFDEDILDKAIDDVLADRDI